MFLRRADFQFIFPWRFVCLFVCVRACTRMQRQTTVHQWNWYQKSCSTCNTTTISLQVPLYLCERWMISPFHSRVQEGKADPPRGESELINSTKSLYFLLFSLPLCVEVMYTINSILKGFPPSPCCVRYWTAHKLLKLNSVYEYTLKETQEALWEKKWRVSPVARSSTVDLKFKCAKFQFLGEKTHETFPSRKK